MSCAACSALHPWSLHRSLGRCGTIAGLFALFELLLCVLLCESMRPRVYFAHWHHQRADDSDHDGTSNNCRPCRCLLRFELSVSSARQVLKLSVGRACKMSLHLRVVWIVTLHGDRLGVCVPDIAIWSAIQSSLATVSNTTDLYSPFWSPSMYNNNVAQCMALGCSSAMLGDGHCDFCCNNPTCFNDGGDCVLPRPVVPGPPGQCPVNVRNPYEVCGGRGFSNYCGLSYINGLYTYQCSCLPSCGSTPGLACENCQSPCPKAYDWPFQTLLVPMTTGGISLRRWDGTLLNGDSVLAANRKSGAAFKTPTWSTSWSSLARCTSSLPN